MVLRGVGLNLEAMRGMLEDKDWPRQQGRRSSWPQPAPRSKKALELALREALIVHRQERMGTEPLLLGLLREGEESTIQMIVDLGVEPEAIRLLLTGPRRTTSMRLPIDDRVS